MIEFDYYDTVKAVLDQPLRKTRNSNTKSTFGVKMSCELLSGYFPLLTGRKIYYKPVFGELEAFFKGPKNISDFKDKGCNYWDDWGDEDGNLTLDYCKWIDFNGVNQLSKLQKGLIADPHGRRHIVTSWDPSTMEQASLPCCHILYQWYITDNGCLDMIWYQRSVDLMVGMPSDIVLAGAWNIALASRINKKPGKLTFMLGDVHIYEQHIEGAVLYLKQAREVYNKYEYAGYKYIPNSNKDMFYEQYSRNSIDIINYNPLPPIKFELIP